MGDSSVMGGSSVMRGGSCSLWSQTGETEDGRGPTRTGDPLGVNEVLWPTELRAPVTGVPRLAGLRSCARAQSRPNCRGVGGGDRAAAGAGADLPPEAGGEQDLIAVGPLREGGQREREGPARGEAPVGACRFGDGESEEPQREPGADGEAAVGSAGVERHRRDRRKRERGAGGAEGREASKEPQKPGRAGTGGRGR